jgi:signal transduction histidine kinase/ActR/RegA family two-component response regulator
VAFSKRIARTTRRLAAASAWLVATLHVAGSPLKAQATPAAASTAAAASAGSIAPRAEVPSGVRLRSLAERRFDAASGLRAATAFAMAFDGMGIPWLAADDGLYRYDGGMWRRDPVLREFDSQQVRSLWFSADGTAWLGTRRGLIRRPAHGDPMVYRENNGLPGPVIYSLVESQAIDGTRRVVAGGSTGAAWFNGATFVPIRMPALPAPWVGVMVASGESVDGAPTLWAANSSGGVARLARGGWTTYAAAQGLSAPDAQFVLPVTHGTLRGVYVATSAGVYVASTDDADTRFQLIPGSPRGVYRLAFVPGFDGRDELWSGTADGTLWRWRAGAWSRVESAVSARRGTVTLLQPVPAQAGGTAIYASARNGYLVRITNGVAATADFTPQPSAPIVTALAVEARPTRADHLWIATQDDGLVEALPEGLVRVHPFRAGSANGMVSLLRRDVVSVPAVNPGTDTVTLAVAGGTPWRQQGATFVPLSGGLGGFVHDLRRVRMPDGMSTLVASTDHGVRQWTGSTWTPVPGLDGDAAGAMLDGTLGGEPVVYIGSAHAVRIFGRRGLRVDSLPGGTTRSSARGMVTRLCRTRSARGDRLFALVPDRGVFWRDERPDGVWRVFPANPVLSLANSGALNMRCLSDGEVAISSFSGLTFFDVSPADTAAWRVRASVSDADGLPSVIVSDVAVGGGDRVWAATPYGLGVVDRMRAETPPSGRVMLHVSVGATGLALTEGEVLAEPNDDIHVDPQLLTFHREEATRFRIRMTRERPWTMGGGGYVIGEETGELVDAGSRMYHDLLPGRYTLEVRAYDWAGREYGPAVQHFSVETPLALRWYALLSYLLLAGGTLYAIFRFRVGTIERANAGLLASERRARDSERRFRTLFEQALDAHLLMMGGRVQAANAEAARLFGEAQADALVGRDLRALLGDPNAQCASGEHRIRRGDLLVPVQCTVTDVPTEQGPLQHVVMRDLTDARKAEAERAWFETQVREAQKLESLGTLAGGVAHDFNNLLGVVRGNAELARSAQKKGRASEEYLAAILDASDRARDIVKQILTFSRRSTPTREYVNLSSLVVELQPLLRRMVLRTVSISVEGADTMQLIMGDPTQLQQLLLNLVSNADYAMRGRTDGHLRISLAAATVPEGQPAPTGDVVVLRVSDNGEGMSEEVRARIFEPFFTTKPTGEGTGLGMAVVHGIVVSHEGRAEVISAPSAGTTFEMRFPRARLDGLFDDELDADVDLLPAVDDGAVTENLMLGTPPHGTAVSPAVHEVDEARFAGTTIVVVDDEPTVARVVERALEQYGHVVRVFLNPETALAYLRERIQSVDLLITDQTMPGMTGDQLAEAVKALRPNLPVLILTGYSHRLTAERVAAVRARAVLLKPVELEVLKRAVDDALAAGAASGG